MSLRTKEDAISYGLSIAYAILAVSVYADGHVSMLTAGLLWISLSLLTTAVLTLHLYYRTPTEVA